jgi:RNA polymerase sigma factor (sigma-70 family)
MISAQPLQRSLSVFHGGDGETKREYRMREQDTGKVTDRDVAAVLAENHGAFLAFLERRVESRSLAEDILQDAFLRSVEKADAIHDRDAIRPWFYRVLRNAITDHHRRQSTALRSLAAFEVEIALHDPDRGLHDGPCRCVKRLVDTLKAEYAEALRRIEIDGESVKEYAMQAGITSNNAGVRVHRARNALRNRVKKTCGTCAMQACVDCVCDPSA